MFNFKVIFQVALTILDIKKEELLACREDGEAMAVLCDFMDNIVNSNSTTPNIIHTSNSFGDDKKSVEVSTDSNVHSQITFQV